MLRKLFDVVDASCRISRSQKLHVYAPAEDDGNYKMVSKLCNFYSKMDKQIKLNYNLIVISNTENKLKENET